MCLGWKKQPQIYSKSWRKIARQHLLCVEIFSFLLLQQSCVIPITCRSSCSCPCWGSSGRAARLQRGVGGVLQAAGSVLRSDQSPGNATASSSTTGTVLKWFLAGFCLSGCRYFFACLLLCSFGVCIFFSSKIAIRIMSRWLCLPDNLNSVSIHMFGDCFFN